MHAEHMTGMDRPKQRWLCQLILMEQCGDIDEQVSEIYVVMRQTALT